MNISEVKDGMMGVNIKGKVKSIGEIREVNTRFGPNKVAEAVVEDSTGQIKLTLWGDQIEKVKIGKTVEVINGMTREWQDQVQISVGRRGELKVDSDEM